MRKIKIIKPLQIPNKTKDNHETPENTTNNLSPRTQYLKNNTLLWAMARGNQLITFQHINNIDAIHSCLKLRFEIDVGFSPLTLDEYDHFDNLYCVCSITDFLKRETKVLGYILYIKTDKNTLYILDIVFHPNKRSFQLTYPLFKELNVSASCIKYFSEYIDQIGYKCKWRPEIKLKIVNKNIKIRSKRKII